MTVTFNLAGIDYMALNAGPHFKLNEACSIMVHLDTQDEIDRVWTALLSDGGKPSQCGWLTDRFGVTWQVIPTMFTRLMESGEKAATGRMMAAMMKMVKMDIAGLQAAYDGKDDDATKKRQRDDDNDEKIETNGKESKTK